MNKIVKYVLSLVVATVGLTACETYGDPKYTESAIGPVMSGYWIYTEAFDITDPANPVSYELVDAYLPDMKSYETTMGDVDKMWLYMPGAASRTSDKGETNVCVPLGIRAKISIDVASLSILPTEGVSTLPIKLDPNDSKEVAKTYPFKVISGKVIRDGYTTASGGKADLIEVIYMTDFPAVKGRTFKVIAWRDTLWPEDY